MSRTTQITDQIARHPGNQDCAAMDLRTEEQHRHRALPTLVNFSSHAGFQ
ncbi:hypothetical protein SynA15127_01274 [Synechococcus sp. A15-127]|nr:hypothetical protein SynA15127_01274 [Synechococcus sp. A15-127]